MKKIYIKTYGCTLNQKDSEQIIKDTIVTNSLKDLKKTDVVIVNTCGVKEQTQTKILNYIKNLKKIVSEKNIHVCGCLVDIDREAILKIAPNANLYKVSERKKLEQLLPKNKKDIQKKLTSTIIISNGCLGNCAYCAVKFARGKLDSKPIKKIIEEINSALENGAKEIQLTSQDTACYGLDIKTNLIELLEEIINIKKDFKIRLGMGNPQHLKPILKDLIKIYKNNKMYKFLHIPIQSGDNKVLKEMNRYYKIEDVFEIINEFKKQIKDISIATDIIVGYPTENEKQFENTLKALKKMNVRVVNISRFGQRKGIEANKYKDLKGDIKKKRSREATLFCENLIYNNNKKYLGKTIEVFINEKGKNNTLVGRTNNYISVVLEGYNNLKISDKINMKITDLSKYYLISKNSYQN